MPDQLYYHLLRESLNNPSQHGSVRTRYCSRWLTDSFNKVPRIRNQQKLMVELYFDIKKALDQVPHNFLINRRYSIEVVSPLLHWVTSFLKNRGQIIKINSTLTTTLPIPSRIMLGGVLVSYADFSTQARPAITLVILKSSLKVTYVMHVVLCEKYNMNSTRQIINLSAGAQNSAQRDEAGYVLEILP